MRYELTKASEFEKNNTLAVSFSIIKPLANSSGDLDRKQVFLTRIQPNSRRCAYVSIDSLGRTCREIAPTSKQSGRGSVVILAERTQGARLATWSPIKAAPGLAGNALKEDQGTPSRGLEYQPKAPLKTMFPDLKPYWFWRDSSS